jgi:hypothetical protein
VTLDPACLRQQHAFLRQINNAAMLWRASLRGISDADNESTSNKDSCDLGVALLRRPLEFGHFWAGSEANLKGIVSFSPGLRGTSFPGGMAPNGSSTLKELNRRLIQSLAE